MRLPRLPLRLWMAVSHLMVLALPLLALLLTGSLARELQRQAQGQLVQQGAAIAALAQPALLAGDAQAGLAPALGRIEAETGVRIELLDAEGRVRAGTPPRNSPESLADRSEVQSALRGSRAVAVRHRPKGCEAPECRGLVRVFVATPILEGGRVIGVVRVSRAPARALELLAFAGWPLWLALGLALLCTVALAVAWGHVLSRSLRALSRTSRRLRDGTFEAATALERPARSHVAEVGELARDLGGMAERLEQRLAYIGEFASNVSHEFRTPITTLRGTVELLRDDPDMDPAQRARFLENALADLARMERLIAGLLALARAERQGPRAPVDLDALLAALAERHGLTVEGAAGVVPGDATQLAAAIGNLLENAQQHGAPPVRLRCGREAGTAWIEVRDGGPGISAANLPRVFERFFTTGRERGRAGLGLALVRAIARTHGGEVRAESRPGETCFRVELPGA